MPYATITTDTHELSTSYLSARKLVRTTDGVLHAVYYRNDEFYKSQIYHAYSSDEGETWTEEALTSGSYHQLEPSIAVDSNDNLHVVWSGYSESSPDLRQIRYRKYDGSWGDISDLTSGYYTQDYPSIAIDSNDYLHIVWNGNHSESATYYQIRYIKYTTSWSGITNLTSASYSNYEPSIAIDGNDYLHIVWAGDNIEYRKFTDSWQDIVKLEDSEYYQDCPCIAVDGNNYVHVVWYGNHSGSTHYFQIRYRKYTDSWQTIENITSDEHEHYEPSIAVDSNNYLNVVWYGETPSSNYWQVRHIKHSSSWGSVEDLTSGDTNKWYPNTLCARHLDARQTTKTGFTFIFVDGTTLKYYASADLAWGQQYVRSGTASLGLVGAGTRPVGYVRSDTGLLGLLATATRSWALSREDTTLLGLKATASRIITPVRAQTALLGLKATASETVDYAAKTGTALLGLLATGSRTIALSRSKTALLGLKAIGAMSTLGHYTKEGIVYLGLAVAGTRPIVLTRAETALLGLKATATKAITLTRADTALLGLKTTGVLIIPYIRTGTVYLGLKITASRSIALTRLNTALLGLKAVGTRSLALSRAKTALLGLKVIGSLGVPGRALKLVIVTTQNRKLNVLTSLYRKIRILTE